MCGVTYPFADWQAGIRPPKGWDCANAVEDGWTAADVTTWMRATVCDVLPAWRELEAPPAPEPEPPAPEPAPPPARLQGADCVSLMPRVMDVEHGSEVHIAGRLADALGALCGGSVVYADGGFWAFGPTAWREISQQRLRLAVHQFDMATVGGKSPIKIGKKMIDGILSETGTILGEPEFFHDPTVALNAMNTVVTIADDGSVQTRKHDPADRFRFTIPTEFHLHTDMHPPEGSMLYRLLEGAFRGDADAKQKFDLIGEILGAAAFGIATRLPQPKAFVFLGETASNGKSTVASLLQCLLPDGSVSAIPPSAYEDERRIVNLAGKAANVADELSASAISGETFKAAITGNRIEGRDLYRSAMTFVPRALHLFTTNTLPRFNGGLDRGLQRRLVVLRFNRPIPEDEIVADIADRIRRDELDLLLGMAIAGAQRLTKNRGYTIPPSSVEALTGWLRLDPVNEWFEERIMPCEVEPIGGWLRTSALFKNFKAWALEQGHAERFLPPVNTFSQRLRVLPGVQLKVRSYGTMVTGVDLRVDGGNERDRF